MKLILLGDLQLQKQTWYKPKMANIIKCLAVTALNGKFAAIFPLATSISPKSGDTYLVSAFLKHQDCSQTEDILPFRRLLQGSDDKFLLMFSDSGFEHLAPQVLFITILNCKHYSLFNYHYNPFPSRQILGFHIGF